MVYLPEDIIQLGRAFGTIAIFLSGLIGKCTEEVGGETKSLLRRKVGRILLYYTRRQIAVPGSRPPLGAIAVSGGGSHEATSFWRFGSGDTDRRSRSGAGQLHD